MNNELAMARRDLEDATGALGDYWTCDDDRDAIGRVATAAEALLRAISSVSLVVERLSEAGRTNGA